MKLKGKCTSLVILLWDRVVMIFFLVLVLVVLLQPFLLPVGVSIMTT